MAILHKTTVQAAAKHKITHEWRSLFGIIGSWHEVLAEAISKPSIIIETTTPEYDRVIINGKDYAPSPQATQ